MSFEQDLITAYTDMIDMKVSLGFARRTYSTYISQFIDFCVNNYPGASEITKDILDQWLVARKFKTDNTRRLAIINVRHFTQYLNATGKRAYVPSSEYNVRTRRYQPYIFTDDELTALFNAIDSLTNIKGYGLTRPDLILPVAFRLELCCGMRPAEPFNLRMEDVNLESGDMFIRKSKRGKDRHIIMSEDMRQLCATYNSIAGSREWFFQYYDGGKVPARWARWNFARAWDNSGLSIRVNTPRPYDLRHNFATRTLMRWVDEGRDIMTLMPYLRTYMGHSGLEETLYYIHLLPERIKASPGIDWDMMSDIYCTEGDLYEED